VRKAEKVDKANTVVLVETEAELGQRLQAMRNKTSKSTFLSRQVAARIDGRKFTYPTAAVPNKYRSEKIKDKNTGNKKIKRSPSSGDEVVYLNELVVLMIKEDIKQGRYSGAAAGAGSSDKTLARQLPVISDEYTSAYSQKLKMEEREETAQLWDIDDDDDLVEITDKYVGEIAYFRRFFACTPPPGSAPAAVALSTSPTASSVLSLCAAIILSTSSSSFMSSGSDKSTK
tara:strand:+ start:1864 stop:2553 length:690 start_codon:yes stop_codon:yes gene_type:complete